MHILLIPIRRPFLVALALFVALFSPFASRSALYGAENPAVPPRSTDAGRPHPGPEPLFPSLYLTERLQALETENRGQPYWSATEAELALGARRLDDFKSILLNEDVVAFYGSPLSKRMGILGWYPIQEMDGHLSAVAQEYDQANGERGVRKAFYIIFGTAWPEGEIGILRESVLKEYIEYALSRDILVFIDHQIGKYDVAAALKRMLPYLRYPNVHLALDPEWRTLKPMVEIGTVSAEELNSAQQLMQDYIVTNGLPGERLLVVHQFNWRMISSREAVNAGFSRVRLVHCADGFGAPALKRLAYKYNAEATNMPVKGFKLFYNSGLPGAGFDEPLLSPEEVFALDPRPYVVMYQ